MTQQPPSGPYDQNPYGGAPGSPYGSGTPGAGVPAEVLPRFLARLIDGLLLAAISFVMGLVLGGGAVLGGASAGTSYAVSALISLLGVAIGFGYFGYLDSSQGGTLGKKALSLRVVGAGGGNPSFTESVKRNVFLAIGILGLVPFLGLVTLPLSLVAYITIAVGISQDTDRRQAWHDRFAGGTQVVKTG